MYLAELFDSDSDFSIIEKSSYDFATEMKVGDRLVLFSAESVEMMYPPDKPRDEAIRTRVWEISFAERASIGYTYKATGSGNEFKVFSFVMKSLKLFVEKYHPKTITFTSEKKDASRTKLYKKITERYSQKYKVQTFEVSHDTVFVLSDLNAMKKREG